MTREKKVNGLRDRKKIMNSYLRHPKWKGNKMQKAIKTLSEVETLWNGNLLYCSKLYNLIIFQSSQKKAVPGSEVFSFLKTN